MILDQDISSPSLLLKCYRAYWQQNRPSIGGLQPDRICTIGPHFAEIRDGKTKQKGQTKPLLKASAMLSSMICTISRFVVTFRRSHNVKCRCSDRIMRRHNFLCATHKPYCSSSEVCSHFPWYFISCLPVTISSFDVSMIWTNDVFMC